MARYKTFTPNQEELRAADALRAYFDSSFGAQAMIARITRIDPAGLVRMAQGKQPISMAQAILIELASDGEFHAEFLCPSDAAAITAFRSSKPRADKNPPTNA